MVGLGALNPQRRQQAVQVEQVARLHHRRAQRDVDAQRFHFSSSVEAMNASKPLASSVSSCPAIASK
ncbi:hypothetical protein SSTU70S_05599 [Stutzerimonas stutzeri]